MKSYTILALVSSAVAINFSKNTADQLGFDIDPYSVKDVSRQDEDDPV